jgi:hypothetical protein
MHIGISPIANVSTTNLDFTSYGSGKAFVEEASKD